jgi:hypothetical protein
MLKSALHVLRLPAFVGVREHQRSLSAERNEDPLRAFAASRKRQFCAKATYPYNLGPLRLPEGPTRYF